MTFNFDTKTKKKLKGKDRKKLLFFAGIIMILLPVAYLTLKKPSTAEASWWTGGGGEWQKRKHLTVTNDSSENLAANTTIAVSLDTQSLADGGKVRSDCNDIRIVYQPNSSTQTELDRYLSYPDGQTCETSQATKIYFSLQTALNSSADSEDYYVYFDNNEASSPSSQVDAFDIGSKNALMACPFDGTTNCINGDGTEDPTTESGAVRYGGGKSALYFDGYDAGSGTDRVHYPGSGLDNLLLNDTTIEFWAFWQDNGLDEIADTIVSKDWEIYFQESQKRIVFWGDCASQNVNYWTDTNVVNYGEWTHVAVTFDSNTGTAKIFINGSEASSYYNEDACQGGYVDDSDQDFWVGRKNVVSNHFPGFVEELRISNVIRYPGDFTPPTEPFVRDDFTELLYHFDEAGDDPRKTTLALDDSGNGFDGTIDGAKYVTGIVGIAPPTSSNIDSQSYASHEGIFIEEGTTNKITNPSFEHSTYNTNWTNSSTTVLTQNTDISFNRFGSNSAKLDSAGTRYTKDNYSSSNQGLYITTDNKRLSQGFQVSSGYSPSTASLFVRRIGSASRYVRTEIQTDSSGVPSGTPVTSGTSDCIDYASIGSGQQAYHDFTFATPPSLSASTQYHLVLLSFTDSACTVEQSSTDDTNYINWSYDNTSATYSSGDRATMNDSSTWSTQSDEDHIFALSNTGTLLSGIDPSNTEDHILSAYVYAGYKPAAGGGYAGGEVDATVAELIFDGTAQTTTYTDTGGGWWRMTYSGTPPEGTADYGVEIKTSKIIAIDGVQLEEKARATTYADGSLGTGYSWSGTENDSTSTRTVGDLEYSNTNNISTNAGTISFWYNRKLAKFAGGMDLIRWTGGSDKIHIYQNGTSGDFLRFDVRTDGGVNRTCETGDWDNNTNEWEHVVLTYTFNDAGNDGCQAYIDGSAAGAGSSSQTWSFTGSSDIYIGENGSGGGQSGSLISDLHMYDDDLTAAEVTDLYYSGLVAHSQEYEVDAFSGNKGQDPVAVWHFDEGYGTAANDSSSYGNDLTVTGASWEVGSVGGRAKLSRNLSFDGSYDFLSRYTDKDFNFSDDSFTISGWVRHPVDADGTQDMILARHGDAGYKVYMDGSGYLCFGIDDDSTWSPADEACGSTDLTDSRWHHFSAVKDGTTSITMYVDGASVGSDAALSATGSLNTPSTLYVGIDTDEQSYPFEGYMDELIIYPYARSADQINSDFAGGQTGVVFGQQVEDWMTDGLVGYWPFSETSWDSTTDVVLDYSGMGGHGDLIADGGTEPSLSIGKFDNGGVFDFDGSGYVEVHDDSWETLTGKDAVTVSAWIRPDFTESDSNNHWVFLHDRAKLWFRETQDDFGFNTYTSTGSGTVTTTGLSWAQNTWHHIVGVYDGSTMYIYWDGELEETTSHSGALLENFWPVTIGASVTSSDAWAGTLDEVRLYNRALSSTEVEKLHKWAPGPIFHADFNEGSGTTTLYDKSGNDNNGTMNNITNSDWISGKFGKALDFSGSSTYVDFNDPVETDLGETSESYSYMAWVKPESFSSNGFVLTKGQDGWGSSDVPYKIYIDTSGGNGYASCFLKDGTNDDYVGTSSNNDAQLSLNTWQHIACIRDTNSDALKLYLDGIQVDETTDTTTAAATTNDDMVIGARSGSKSENFVGGIDEVKVYDYARTQQQIIEDMNAGHPVPGSPVGSTNLHLKFDQGYGDTAYDSSQYGNNGNLGGSGQSCPASGTVPCPTWSNSGKYSKALEFDGGSAEDQDDVLFVGSGDAIDNIFDGGGTLSAWINTQSQGESAGRVAAKISSSNGWQLFVNEESGSTTKIKFQQQFDSNDGMWDTVNYDIPYDTWAHVAVTYNSDSASNDATIYVNGIEVDGTASLVPSGTRGDDSPEAMLIGNLEAGDRTFDGLIDDVRLYSSALTASQIKILYTGGASQVLGAISTDGTGPASWAASAEYCPPGDSATCNPPVAEWKFDEYTGTSAYDTSENNNTGTLTNGPTWQHGGNCKKGTCLFFDGASGLDQNDVVDAGSDTSIDDIFDGGGTASFWVYPQGAGESNTGRVLLKSGTNAGWYINKQPCDANNVDIQMRTQTTGIDAQFRVDCGLSTNKWNHVSVTYDDDSNNSSPTFYINGLEKSLDLDTTSDTTYVSDASQDLFLGSGGATGVDTFDGLIDEIRLYDYERTPAQIAWEYNKGGPVGWWKFDECSGTNVYDSSGFSNNGTITIGALGDITSAGTCGGSSGEAWAAGEVGKFNSSLAFDGSDDYIEVSDDTAFEPNSYITVSAWIKPDAPSSGEQQIISHYDDSPGSGYQLLIHSSGYPYFRIHNGASPYYGYDSTVLTADTWYHIVGVYDPDAASAVERICVYVNGRKGDSCGVVPVDSSLGNPGVPLRIGVNSYNMNFDYNGLIDEVKVFNYAFTQEQINNDYTSGAARFN